MALTINKAEKRDFDMPVSLLSRSAYNLAGRTSSRSCSLNLAGGAFVVEVLS